MMTPANILAHAATPRADNTGSNALLPRGVDVVPPEEPLAIGVAIAAVGEYVTPLTVAATWNTDPPPYS